MLKNTFNECIVFTGPTRATSRSMANDSSVQWRGPIRRGDLAELVSTYAPTNVAIVDGIFHSYPAVGHSEIDEALQKGWRIWGLSSMGAIRAAEMAEFGMRGYGKVYKMFVDDEDFSDDEVTLVHNSDAPYEALSEPLVHFRVFLSSLVEQGIANFQEHDVILQSLKSRWYGYRTIELMERLLERHLANSADALRQMVNFDHFRFKAHDLMQFISEKPWMEKDESNNFERQIAI
ncbi:TfuA-like protein [Burkholderia ubonensis]|uniref:TfuA-like protein n=1 Tax=Burkholderia ubonensis TaxID=101571 RepID=UPI0009B53296|nr:TfuA-like protein [Burkholderia ubonensis]